MNNQSETFVNVLGGRILDGTVAWRDKRKLASAASKFLVLSSEGQLKNSRWRDLQMSNCFAFMLFSFNCVCSCLSSVRPVGMQWNAMVQ